MKVRVKFEKTGVMKFIGHLDMMRYFQKAIRRAEIPISFSEGFSPHMIMSFAAPLGVGVTSSGEYFDMELDSQMSSREMTERFNRTMADGIEVKSVRKIPDVKASKAMSLVAATDYYVEFREGLELSGDWKSFRDGFWNQDSIIIMKKTKRSEQELDIRPWIYQFKIVDNRIFMQLASGSANNLKPDLVMEAFARFVGQPLKPFALMIHRQEVYADSGTEEKRKLVSLEELGEIIE